MDDAGPEDQRVSGTYLEAAIEVLDAAKRPMTDREITEEAIRRGLISPSGKTPTATMSAALYVDAQKNPDGRLVRLAEPGGARARRGSVRWTLRR